MRAIFPLTKRFTLVTQIDRYILLLFLRTVLVCFLSLAGIFIVFHAFTAFDDLIALTETGESLPSVLFRFYGPYLLMLFDMTGTVTTLMAFLFTVGWLRRTGELTATLSAGVSHGRIFRPMVVATLIIISFQLISREFFIPQFRNSLTMKVADLDGEVEQSVRPTFDKSSGILLEGKELLSKAKTISRPNFRIQSDCGSFGELLVAREAVWVDAKQIPQFGHSGYLLTDVSMPKDLNRIASAYLGERPVLMTSYDNDWLGPGQCFFATSIHPNMLQTKDTAIRLAPVTELAGRVGNPAVHSSLALQTLLHERIVRAPLDFALVLMILPMVVNRSGRKLFLIIGSAVGLVLGFFALKTIAGGLGGSGTIVTPAIAAWIPLMIIGPLAYVRLKAVQLV